MAENHCLKCQPLFLARHSLFSDPFDKMIVTYPESSNSAFKSPLFHTSPLLSHQTGLRKYIVCARKGRRHSKSQKVRRILPKLISIVISNPNMLPPPLNLVIEEIISEDEGGFGFLKSFKGGSFNGWKRKEKKNLGILGVLLLLLIAKGDLFCGVLALGLYGAVLIKGSKKGVKDWILGLCLLGALMGLGLKREDGQKWIEKLRDSSPVLQLFEEKRRRK